MVQRMFIICFS